MPDAPAPSSAPAAPAASPTPSSAAPSSSSAPAAGKAQSFAEKAAGVTTPDSSSAETSAEKKTRLLKLKVDKGVSEVDVNAMSDEELTLELQMAKASRKKMQEIAEYRKSLSASIEKGKTDLPGAIKELYGIDLQEWAQNDLGQKYEMQLKESQLTPEQKERRAIEQERDAAKAEAEKWKKEHQTKAQADMDARLQAETESTFTEAMKSEGIEPSYETLREMARIGLVALKNGLQLTPLESKVRAGLKGDKLLSYLGDDTVKEVLRAAVAKAQPKGPFETKTADPEGADNSVDRNKRKTLTTEDFKRFKRGF